MKSQVLDSMDLERERGITIKSHPIQMKYFHKDQNEYVFNLIDTPGHVDFSYEVSRSLAACEGTLLLVDAVQGVEAQTVSNTYLAIDNDLTIIPVINKVDLPSARVDVVRNQLIELIGCEKDEIVSVSAKTGEGVQNIFNAIIDKIPAPNDRSDKPLRAMILILYMTIIRAPFLMFVYLMEQLDLEKKHIFLPMIKCTMSLRLVILY